MNARVEMVIREPRKSRNDVGKLEQRLRRQTGRAIADFNMIGAGDRVMVCLSGGKDSYTLLDMLLRLRARAPVDFEILAVHLDQKQPGYDPQVMRDYFRRLDVEHHIIEQDTYSVVKRVIPEGRTMCGLCSRLRRGILYTFAAEQGVTRIALGHHRDDIVETLFLNMFFGAKLKSMPPKLQSDDGRHIVVRPLAYCCESDIAAYAAAQAYPIIPCNLCGSQDHLQRVKIKAMLADWERDHPGRVENVFRSLQAVVPSHLADPALFDFSELGNEPSSERRRRTPDA
jgi:tRNA 2-thiocytidine biosynthesis protein TtcA